MPCCTSPAIPSPPSPCNSPAHGHSPHPRPQVTEAECRLLSGSLPAWLHGTLVVNGGGDYSGMLHMFDGMACLTRVRLTGGKAWGSQRYLQSDAYK